MKKLLLLLFCVFQAGSVLAGSCLPVESDELKDLSSEKLVRTYCTYNQFALNNSKAAMASLELMKKADTQGLSTATFEKKIAEHMASAKECSEQVSKIKSALDNRSVSTGLDCAAQLR